MGGGEGVAAGPGDAISWGGRLVRLDPRPRSFSLLPWLDEKIIIPRERSVMGNEIIPAPFVLVLLKPCSIPCLCPR